MMNSTIFIGSGDGVDYSEVEGEVVGSGRKVAIAKGALSGYSLGGVISGIIGGILKEKEYRDKMKEIDKLVNEKASRSEINKKLVELSNIAGSGLGSRYEGIYVINDEKLRDYFLSKDEKGEKYLDIQKYDSEGLSRIENTKLYKKAVSEIINQAKIKYIMASDITNLDEKGRLVSKNPKTKNHNDTKINSEVFKLAGSENINKADALEYALGKTSLTGSVRPNVINLPNGNVQLTISVRYQISDTFEDPTGMKFEWGKSYAMRGRVIEILLPEFSRTFKNREEYLKFAKNKANRK